MTPFGFGVCGRADACPQQSTQAEVLRASKSDVRNIRIAEPGTSTNTNDLPHQLTSHPSNWCTTKIRHKCPRPFVGVDTCSSGTPPKTVPHHLKFSGSFVVSDSVYAAL